MTGPPLDEVGHRDRVLMAEIGKLNERLGRYILHHLADDALQAESDSLTEEYELADTMVALAGKVQARANRRNSFLVVPVLEGEVIVQRRDDDRPSEHC